jgi:putative SOS response-associated peptidase YedK
MCGRYALSRTELLKEFFEFSFTGNQILPRFNVAPTTQIPVIRLRDDGQRELIDVRWGLVPSWSRPGDQLPLLINARAETLSSKPAFRDAFQRRRCIVPASGYYEWQKLPGGAKQPFYITRRDGLPIAFAGLWENAKESLSLSVQPADDTGRIWWCHATGRACPCSCRT